MTYELIIEIALKSVVTSGIALLLLALMRGRSAGERSWIAHTGLLATLVLPLAAAFMPKWYIEEPAPAAGQAVEAPASILTIPAATAPAGEAVAPLQPLAAIDFGSIAFWLYALVASALLLVTLLAIVRLFMLRGRASVLVEPSWLSALAHAQRRMGFKHGTALLVSDALGSPVSWGVLRPIILLNEEALNSQAEAEAIIAHELAHVAHLDWAKLVVARAATALFWFNPLVWVLARQCHQLREEAADDAVLLTDVPCTDYAALLIGAARHDSKPTLLAANGVAPGRGSLKRRVTRVLDTKLSRAPARIGWGAACTLVGLAIAAPLSAVTAVTPPANLATEVLASQPPRPAPFAVVAEAAASSARLALTAATGAEATTAPAAALPPPAALQPVHTAAEQSAPLPGRNAPVGADIGDTVTAALAQVNRELSPEVMSRIRLAALAKDKWVKRNGVEANPALPTPEQLVEMRIHGISSEYIRELQQAGHRNLSHEELASARIHGVSPEYVREVARAGYPHLTIRQLTNLRIHGVTPAFIRGLAEAGHNKLSYNDLVNAAIHKVSPEFVRGMAAAGYPGLTMSQLTSMRIHRVSPAFVQEMRAIGFDRLPAKQLIDMRVQGAPKAERDPRVRPREMLPPPSPVPSPPPPTPEAPRNTDN